MNTTCLGSWTIGILTAILVAQCATASPQNDLQGILIAGKKSTFVDNPTVKAKIIDKLVQVTGGDEDYVLSKVSTDFCATANTNITVAVGWYPVLQWQGALTFKRFVVCEDCGHTNDTIKAVGDYINSADIKVKLCRKSERTGILAGWGVQRKESPDFP